MFGEGDSYWRIFSIGFLSPLVLSLVLVALSHLIMGPGVLLFFAYTCIWPLTAFGFAIYSRIYESDELSEGAFASGLLGTLLGILLVIMAIDGFARGMASFSQ